MEKRLKTICGFGINDFEYNVNVFLAKITGNKIIDVKYMHDKTEDRYLAFIIYQI